MITSGALNPGSVTDLQPIEMKFYRTIIFGLLLLSISCSPIDKAYLPSSEEDLAQDIRIKIGGHTITAPAIVFLVSTTRTKIIQNENDDGPEIALATDQLLYKKRKDNDVIKAVSIDFYMDSLRSIQDTNTDIHVSTTDSFCKLLSQQWAKNHCSSGLYDNQNVFLPRRFTIIEKTYLLNNLSDISYFSGNFTTVPDFTARPFGGFTS